MPVSQRLNVVGAVPQELIEKNQGIPVQNEANTSGDHEPRFPFEWLAVGVLSGLMMFAFGILLGIAYQKWW